MAENTFNERNDDVGKWGQRYVANLYAELGHQVKKRNPYDTVDLIVIDQKTGAKLAVDVKTQEGTIETLNNFSIFRCIHFEDRKIREWLFFEKDMKIPVAIVWIHISSGKVYFQTLKELLSKQIFQGVEFPRDSRFNGKQAFAAECFVNVKTLKNDELAELNEIAVDLPC